MNIDNNLTKIRIKEYANSLENFSLPSWDSIPNFGLYMEQVLLLVSEYLNIKKKDDKDEGVLTAAAINNYVRMEIIPKPDKKKYYRTHIAYIIIVCALKKSLSISSIGLLLSNFNEDNIEEQYNSFREIYERSTKYIFNRMKDGYITPNENNDLFNSIDMIIEASIIGGLTIDVTELVLDQIKKDNTPEKKSKDKKKDK